MKKEVLDFYLKVGAKNLNISEKLVEFLEKGDAHLEFFMPFERKKGELVKIPCEFFYASRVRGHYFGELHMKEDVNADNLQSLGFLNAFANAFFDIPFGGMCSKIGINEDDYTVWEKRSILREITGKILKIEEFGNFVLLPGRGMAIETVAVIYDEFLKKVQTPFEYILGKPPEIHGIEDFTDIFSELVIFAIETMLEDSGENLKGKKITFYGFDKYSDTIMEKMYARGIKNFILSFEDANFFKVPDEVKSRFLTISEEELVSYETDIFIISETAKEITKEKANFLNSAHVLELKPFSILPEAEEVISRRNLNLMPDIFTRGILNLIYFEEYLKGKNRCKTGDMMVEIKRKFIDVYRDTLGIGIAKNLSIKKTAYMIALGKIMKLISVKGV